MESKSLVSLEYLPDSQLTIEPENNPICAITSRHSTGFIRRMRLVTNEIHRRAPSQRMGS